MSPAGSRREVDRGNQVAVVVSAMAGVTNQLVAYCRQIAPLHDPREYDAVVASGEQVTTGLLAIALQQIGRQGALLDRLADADAHRRRPRQGAHREDRDRRARAAHG